MTLKEAHTLPDVLLVVPDLIPIFLLNLWPSRGAGIRALRLISKEVGCIAVKAITSYRIAPGDLRVPDPERLALLLGGAQLKIIGLDIVTWPGEMKFGLHGFFHVADAVC